MLYSWQQKDYQNLVTAYTRRQFNSLLIYGAANSGSEQLVRLFINYLLCTMPEGNLPCGKCSSCIIYHESQHPDLYILAPEDEESKLPIIKVEQVRAATEFAMLSQHMAMRKLVVIPNARQFNTSSANALLKILEEPPLNCMFILQVNSLNHLLPTIVSRCFKFQLSIPDNLQALEFLATLPIENAQFWLKYFNGEPIFEVPLNNEELLQLQNGLLKPSIDNIFMLSTNLDPKKVGMGFWLDYLTKWLGDLLRCKLGVDPGLFSAVEAELKTLVTKADLEKMFELQNSLAEMMQWAEHPLNHKLQLENLLFKYQQLYV